MDRAFHHRSWRSSVLLRVGSRHCDQRRELAQAQLLLHGGASRWRVVATMFVFRDKATSVRDDEQCLLDQLNRARISRRSGLTDSFVEGCLNHTVHLKQSSKCCIRDPAASSGVLRHCGGLTTFQYHTICVLPERCGGLGCTIAQASAVSSAVVITHTRYKWNAV